MPKNCSHVWLRCEVQAKVLEWYIKVAHSGLLVLQLSEIIAMMTSRLPCRYHEALDARHAPCYTATALSGTATVLYPCIWWHERPLCGPCNGFDILLSSKVILPTERLLALMVIQVVAIGECTFARRCNEIWKKRTSFPENLLQCTFSSENFARDSTGRNKWALLSAPAVKKPHYVAPLHGPPKKHASPASMRTLVVWRRTSPKRVQYGEFS